MNADERGLREENLRLSAKIRVQNLLVFRLFDAKDESALIRSIRVVRVLFPNGTKGRVCLFRLWPYAIIAG